MASSQCAGMPATLFDEGDAYVSEVDAVLTMSVSNDAIYDVVCGECESSTTTDVILGVGVGVEGGDHCDSRGGGKNILSWRMLWDPSRPSIAQSATCIL